MPGLVGKHGNDSHVKAIGTMMTDRDRKTYWDLFETVCWICSRDEEKVAAMWGMSDQEQAGFGHCRNEGAKGSSIRLPALQAQLAARSWRLLRLRQTDWPWKRRTPSKTCSGKFTAVVSA